MYCYQIDLIILITGADQADHKSRARTKNLACFKFELKMTITCRDSVTNHGVKSQSQNSQQLKQLV